MCEEQVFSCTLIQLQCSNQMRCSPLGTSVNEQQIDASRSTDTEQSQTSHNSKLVTKLKDMMLNLRCHTFTVGSKFFVVIYEGQRETAVYLHTSVIFVLVCSLWRALLLQFVYCMSQYFSTLRHWLRQCILVSVPLCWYSNVWLTVCAQSGSQHLNALVSDGVSCGQAWGQRASRRTEGGWHGTGRGGGGFRSISFPFPAEKETWKHSHCKINTHACIKYWAAMWWAVQNILPYKRDPQKNLIFFIWSILCIKAKKQ